jgi:serine/threonine protein kinase
MNTAILTHSATCVRARRTYLRDNQRYRLMGCIARGIGTQLYKAWDLYREGQVVTIKRMEASHTSLERFFGELRMMQALNQRYPALAVTTVLDWFSSSRAWYLVMRFVDGSSLEAVLQQRGVPLPINEVLSIGLDLCAILSVLHADERTVIHRDIKPANVLRDRGRRIVLADFGTACYLDSPVEALFRGTQGYAAPEQSGGMPVTPAADVYGLGATLYELLTGQFPAWGMPLLANTAAIPAEIGQLLQQMVQHDVRRRIGSVHLVEQALLELSHRHMEESLTRCKHDT